MTMKKIFEDANEYVDLEKNVFLYYENKYKSWIFAKKPQDVSTFICYSLNLEDEPLQHLEGNIQCNIGGEYKEYSDLNVVENKCRSCTTTTTTTTMTMTTTTTISPEATTTTTVSQSKQGKTKNQHS